MNELHWMALIIGWVVLAPFLVTIVAVLYRDYCEWAFDKVEGLFYD